MSHDPKGQFGHHNDVILGRPLWQPLLLADPEKKQKRGRKESLAEFHNKQALAKEIIKTDRFFHVALLCSNLIKLQFDPHFGFGH